MRRICNVLVLLVLVLTIISGMAACTTNPPDPFEQTTEEVTAQITTDKVEQTTSGQDPDDDPDDDPDTPIGEIVKAERQQLSFDATVSITEQDDGALVKHADGLCYLASGYTSLDGNVLHFTKGLVLHFDTALTADAFNRITLGYYSTQPLYGKVTYKIGSRSVTDDFYLEAGKDTFSCLISKYLDGKKAKGITEMSFESCSDLAAEFALCVLDVQDYPIYARDDETYFIENDRYKLGIRLAWGGGINYLLDKQCPIEGLENLVNQADTGRLVQQSYYGVVRNEEFEPGEFNDSEWCYNPVQGGDKYLNHSRIIDIVVTEQSVYIKAQPLDWALENYLTPSYMENSYTLYQDRILVDNRFVDFSNWTHRPSQQELPAFYTVSYLSVFSFYNGTQPWTDDTLSYRHDLKFWGDPLYVGDCMFRLRQSNTETWCAWTAPGEGYGFGLYVPNVDAYKAGCYQYNNSKDAADWATNYVAPLKTITLESFEPVEYSYLMATGTLPEMRALFAEHRNFADNLALDKNADPMRMADGIEAYNEYYYDSTGKVPERLPEDAEQPEAKTEPVLDLTNPDDVALIIPTNSTLVKYDSPESGTRLISTGPDPHVTIGLGDLFAAEDYGTLEIVYMLPETNSPSNDVVDVFLCAGDVKTPSGDAMIRVSVIADGEYHTLTVELAGKSFWKGAIHSVRVDFMDQCTDGDTMYVKSITLK